MVYLIIFCIVAFLLWFFVFRKFKVPKLTAITMFTGGVKTGKSAVSLYFAVKSYKRIHRKWRLTCIFAKIFRRQVPEEPLFYSNIPLRHIKYVPLTTAHLLRKVRYRFGSVVFIDEASLLADSRLVNESNEVNLQLLLHFKLFGHETHGGLCIINSQCITDLHVALRRCTSTYFYVHHLGWLPFFRIPMLREEKYSEDGTAINVYNDDVEDSMKRVIMRSSIFKKYDSYCFSFFTDSLPASNNVKLLGKKDSLKSKQIVSFRESFVNLKPSTDKDIVKKDR